MLLDRGLTPLPGGVWALADEVRLRQSLAELPALKESIETLERELQERSVQNRVAWAEQAPARRALEQALARLSPKDPGRKSLQVQLAALQKLASDPQLLGGRDDVRQRLVALGGDRCELAIAVLAIRRTVPRLREQYTALEGDREIQQALQACGEGQRLGPARDYSLEIRRLVEYERLAMNDWVPAYLQSGKTRATAIVNERFPVTFTWTEASDAQATLTTGAVEALGVNIPADAPRTTVKFGKSRSVVARALTLESLRLGRCVAHDVQFLVLPPEAEDLGSQLTPGALSGCRPELQPERLRLVVEAN